MESFHYAFGVSVQGRARCGKFPTKIAEDDFIVSAIPRDSPFLGIVDESPQSERTRLSSGFIGRPRCDVARDLLGPLSQLLASSSLGGA